MVDIFNNEQAEFNMSIPTLNRLHILISTCLDASMRQDSNTWYNGLLNLRKELSGWMTPAELKEITNNLIEIHPSIQMLLKKPNHIIPFEIYWKLDTVEIKLRDVLKRSGMYIKMKEDATTAMRPNG